jgi:hypothetical protein
MSLETTAMKRRIKGCLASVVIAVAALSSVNLTRAQPSGPGPGGGRGQAWWMGEGRMMGPGMMGRGDWGRSCGPAAVGFAQWRIDRLEQEIKLTEAQRARLDELKAASAKAAEAMRAACSAEVPTTMPGRLEAMERRLDAMTQGIKTVRPAVDAFYASLTDEQKARIEGNQGGGRFWRWMHSW